MSKIKRNSTRLVLAGALALLVSVPLALATEVTRETYVAAVEPICKANTQASEKILKGVKAEVKAGKLAPAAAQFTKAAKALKQTLTELKAVPQPKADKSKLTKWLTYIKGEAELFERTATKLKAGDKAGAQRMAILLTHQANLAKTRFSPSNSTTATPNPRSSAEGPHDA
jgi:hypothetical protein